MSNPFTSVPVRKFVRHLFDHSHESLVSTDMGVARVVLAQEVVPGDTHELAVESIVKLAPMKAPVMGRIDVFYQFFFCPNRLLDTSWEGFITSGLKGEIADGTKATPVTSYFDFQKLCTNGMLTDGSVCDDFGLPSLVYQGSSLSDVPPINALPFLAYWKIWSDWFRDEQLSTRPEFVPVNGGEILPADYPQWLTHWNKPWKKDYFTAARPDVQLGASVPIPISGNIVSSGPLRLGLSNGSSLTGRSLIFGDTLQENIGPGQNYAASMNLVLSGTSPNIPNSALYKDGLSLEQAEIIINNLRESLAGQRWKELSMRGGNRYNESIFAHFGVRSSDARLQRSQYLGGRKIPVTIGDVLQSVDTQTAGSAYGTELRPLGERAGIGSSVGRTNVIRHYAEEHGWIICIQSIMPQAMYQQGIPRKLAHRWSRWQYLWPEFANLGEQPVKNFEIFVKADNQNDGDFGYQPQYSEYRTSPNEVHGDFRSSLNFWTTARIFASRPQLNQSFIQLDSSSNQDGFKRLFAVQEGSHFYCHLWLHVKVLRKLSKYGIPSL